MEIAWLAPAAGVAAFVVLSLFRSYLPRQGVYVSIVAIAFGFLLFWVVLLDFLPERTPGHYAITWFSAGGVALTWGITVDALSVTMLGLVTFVALMVQVYSLGYMRGEPRLGWYFAAHSLFAASMLTLVLADNFLLLYIAWELVGACSYLLIGFWYERRSAAEAAKKAFITTRLGDVGLLTGILLLFKVTGTFSMTETFQAVAGGGVSQGVVTAAALLIFLGAMGKSAQVPFHVWLPDAMEGPTPVSALIHAATMVAAGVFLVARTFPLFEAAPGVLPAVAVVGLVTTLMAATMALVATDLKRVLAYSTISHLGFMMLALGAGSVTAALFHLVTHGFSKALLFLGAGSVNHATDTYDIREMGGLRRSMPVTFITFSIGALALAGLPPLSGWFSKDEILAALLHGRNPAFLALALLAALLSALYMARAWLLVFFGRPKHPESHTHESPLIMVAPLVLLASLALTAGLLALNWGPGYQGFGSLLYSGDPERYHFNPGIAVASVLVVAAGLGLAWALYIRGAISPTTIAQRFKPIHQLLVDKYYVDALYQWAIDHVVLVVSRGVALFDRRVVNDRGVNGTGASVVLSGLRLRYLETGKVYNYALGMVLGVTVSLVLWWLAFP